MSAVRSLGYVVISSDEVDAWESFATNLLGLQVSERTASGLRLRNDRYWSRLEVQRGGGGEGVTCLGWEVAGPAELSEIHDRLVRSGYDPRMETEDLAEDRGVKELLFFDDPDGMRVELFYAQRVDRRPFVSPTGASFVTGDYGLGHVFQLVSDEEVFRELYVDVLGFTISDYIAFGPLFGTFLHCNPRHHSYAFAAVPNAPKGIGHIMLEAEDLDAVGRAYDLVLKDNVAPLAISLGRHTNDRMVSFYVNSPSGFEVEFGAGGLLIDDATWTPSRYDAPRVWGHEHQRTSLLATGI